MLHISKSPKTKKYHVALLSSKNHRMLNSAENNGFSSRKGAIKNIRATMAEFNKTVAFVQDNTGPVPVVLFFTPLIIDKTKKKPGKIYVPGKNKKR